MRGWGQREKEPSPSQNQSPPNGWQERRGKCFTEPPLPSRSLLPPSPPLLPHALLQRTLPSRRLPPLPARLPLPPPSLRGPFPTPSARGTGLRPEGKAGRLAGRAEQSPRNSCRRLFRRRDARRGGGSKPFSPGSILHDRFCSPPLPARAAPAPAAPRPARDAALSRRSGPYLPQGNKSPRASSAERWHGRRVLRPRRCGAGGRGRRGGRGGRRAGARRRARRRQRPGGEQSRSPPAAPSASPSARLGVGCARGAQQRRPQPRKCGFPPKRRSASRFREWLTAIGASPGTTPRPPGKRAAPRAPC